MSSRPKSRRLPDTYNVEVISSHVGRGSSVVNPEQFDFMVGAEHLRPTGDPKVTRKLQEYPHMADVASLMRGATRGNTRSEKYRS